MLKVEHGGKLKVKRAKSTATIDIESDMDEETIDRKAEEFRLVEQDKLDKKYERLCAKAEEEGKERPEKSELATVKRELSDEQAEKLHDALSTKILRLKSTRIDKVAPILCQSDRDNCRMKIKQRLSAPLKPTT